MRILSFNANGLRSAASKGFFDWFHTQDIDVMAVQETKAQAHQLTDALFNPEGYHVHFRDSTVKKGYSGVALYSRREPDSVLTAMNRPDFDEEGRYIEARFGNLSVVSFYIPSGSSGEVRQGVKEDVMAWLAPHLDEWLASGRDYVLCGDWNIVRSEKDIKNWKSNQKNSGCLPHERAWLNSRIADTHGDGSAQPEHGWHDSFRVARPDDVEYSWWSQRGGSRGKDVGWRIDYQLLTPGLAERVKHAQHFREPYFSDHAPYLLELDWNENT
ncbi:exodeoxyribonuclease III [Lysobacter sp. HDW10]|uniref:exodeoxyribonuclease III n=1 Tax=Lysobacter sp. HDW10 TaxID=2714936 RepID=UPI00140D397A|nr:exodeoxyribonuclease III [Lysobacter sp. HDW10]QIK80874.1 exodeoxyribonuclease III [Lysobacter sp. HDW10]